MTLPPSGQISLNDICAEFNIPNNAPFPNSFYGLGGAPSSGPLSFADFYGRSASPDAAFNPDGGTVNAADYNNVSTTLTCDHNATWTYGTSSGGIGASVSIGSGSIATSITFSQTAPGTVDRSTTWNVRGVSGNTTRDFVVTLTAYHTDSGS